MRKNNDDKNEEKKVPVWYGKDGQPEIRDKRRFTERTEYTTPEEDEEDYDEGAGFVRTDGTRKTREERENYRDKITRNRAFSLGRTTVAVLMLLAVVGCVLLYLRSRTYTQYEVVSEVERTSVETSKLTELAGTLLTYSNDGAGCTDLTGKSIWNVTFEMKDPILSVCGGCAAIGDYNGRQLYIFNTEGQLAEITTAFPLRSVSVSGDGVTAAVLDDGDVTWIHVYRSNGEVAVTFRTTMSQTGYPVDVAMSPNSTLAGVSYLTAEPEGLRSSVAFYNFGEVGQNETDNYMSGYNYQAVVPYVKFMNSELAFAAADDRIMFFSGGQKPVNKAEVLVEDEILAIYSSEKYVALVSRDTEGKGTYKLRLYDSSGSVKMEKSFDLEYRNIIISDDLVYIYGGSELLMLQVGGSIKFSGNLDTEIQLLIPGRNENRLAVVGPGVIEEIKLR